MYDISPPSSSILPHIPPLSSTRSSYHSSFFILFSFLLLPFNTKSILIENHNQMTSNPSVLSLNPLLILSCSITIQSAAVLFDKYLPTISHDRSYRRMKETPTVAAENLNKTHLCSSDGKFYKCLDAVSHIILHLFLIPSQIIQKHIQNEPTKWL